MTYLPDVNVWLALAVSAHVHHPIAREWERHVTSGELALCRFTEMGLLRLLTNARVMGDSALTAGEAWKVRDSIFSDSRARSMTERTGFEENWRRISRGRGVGPNHWTDAYLIAFCATAGCRLVTFDRLMARHGQGHCEVELLRAI